jgi:hypothetical protein
MAAVRLLTLNLEWTVVSRPKPVMRGSELPFAGISCFPGARPVSGGWELESEGIAELDLYVRTDAARAGSAGREASGVESVRATPPLYPGSRMLSVVIRLILSLAKASTAIIPAGKWFAFARSGGSYSVSNTLPTCARVCVVRYVSN